jgi:hypothetical protein
MQSVKKHTVSTCIVRKICILSVSWRKKCTVLLKYRPHKSSNISLMQSMYEHKWTGFIWHRMRTSVGIVWTEHHANLVSLYIHMRCSCGRVHQKCTIRGKVKLLFRALSQNIPTESDPISQKRQISTPWHHPGNTTSQPCFYEPSSSLFKLHPGV